MESCSKESMFSLGFTKTTMGKVIIYTDYLLMATLLVSISFVLCGCGPDLDDPKAVTAYYLKAIEDNSVSELKNVFYEPDNAKGKMESFLRDAFEHESEPRDTVEHSYNGSILWSVTWKVKAYYVKTDLADISGNKATVMCTLEYLPITRQQTGFPKGQLQKYTGKDVKKCDFEVNLIKTDDGWKVKNGYCSGVDIAQEIVRSYSDWK